MIIVRIIPSGNRPADRVAQAFLPVAKLSQTGMSVLLFFPGFIGKKAGINFSHNGAGKAAVQPSQGGVSQGVSRPQQVRPDPQRVGVGTW